MDKNHTAVMGTNGRLFRQELVAFLFQARHVSIQIIRTEAQVVNTTALFLQVFGNRAFTIERVNQLNTGFRQGEKGCSGFGSFNSFSTLVFQTKVFQKTFDGFLQVRYGNRYVIQGYDHYRLSLLLKFGHDAGKMKHHARHKKRPNFTTNRPIDLPFKRLTMNTRFDDDMAMHRKICLLVLLFFCHGLHAANGTSAVILQYHNVSPDTPASTSVTPNQFLAHLDWLEQHDFHILPLTDVINTLVQKKTFASDRIAAITFDDANRSVCDQAWPILQARQIPFTLFISTGLIEENAPCQCSWAQLQQMAASGLMTAGNHSHTHPHMISLQALSDPHSWQLMVNREIGKAQALIRQHLGVESRFFAYPYGEYNLQLAEEIRKRGMVGFGQHSGAISYWSDFRALPRFPASGLYASLETLPIKLLSLAFPATATLSADSPIPADSADNPPTLILALTQPLSHKVNCYTGQGVAIPTQEGENSIEATSTKALAPGRHRYNCTSLSNEAGRYYWLSHQWLIE